MIQTGEVPSWPLRQNDCVWSLSALTSNNEDANSFLPGGELDLLQLCVIERKASCSQLIVVFT